MSSPMYGGHTHNELTVRTQQLVLESRQELGKLNRTNKFRGVVARLLFVVAI